MCVVACGQPALPRGLLECVRSCPIAGLAQSLPVMPCGSETPAWALRMQWTLAVALGHQLAGLKDVSGLCGCVAQPQGNVCDGVGWHVGSNIFSHLGWHVTAPTCSWHSLGEAALEDSTSTIVVWALGVPYSSSWPLRVPLG